MSEAIKRIEKEKKASPVAFGKWLFGNEKPTMTSCIEVSSKRRDLDETATTKTATTEFEASV